MIKYIVDAQLPKRLKNWLIDYGVEAIHTLDLPLGNDTSDTQIIERSVAEAFIVISKDDDFIQYRLVKGVPEKLLSITTGNIVNNKLIQLFEANFPSINDHFISGAKFIELSNDSVIVHE